MSGSDSAHGGSACRDPIFERMLLDTSDLERWQGLPLMWTAHAPHSLIADVVCERPSLVLVQEGAIQADFTYGQRRQSREFAGGSIGLFAMGAELRHSRWRWAPTQRICVDLGGSLIDAQLNAALGAADYKTALQFQDPELAHVLKLMVGEVKRGCPNGRLYAESLSLGIVMRLCNNGDVRSGGARERGKLTRVQVERLKELIESSLGSPLSITSLAETIGFSQAQFVRLFKNTLGCSPYRYFLDARLRTARSLVVNSDWSLVDVAAATGFASQAHLTESFRRKFSIPPGQLRRQERASRFRDGHHAQRE